MFNNILMYLIKNEATGKSSSILGPRSTVLEVKRIENVNSFDVILLDKKPFNKTGFRWDSL